MSELVGRYIAVFADILASPQHCIRFDAAGVELQNGVFQPVQVGPTDRVGPRNLVFSYAVTASPCNPLQQLVDMQVLVGRLELHIWSILVGEVIILTDDIAADHVFGPYNSPGRPAGRLSITHINWLYRRNDPVMTPDCKTRWRQFVKVWDQAGWPINDVITVGKNFRDLRYEKAHLPEECKRVSADQLLSYVPRCCAAMGLEFAGFAPHMCNFITTFRDSFTSAENALVAAGDVLDKLRNVAL